MNTRIRNRLLRGTALVVLVAGVTYACKDFLTIPAQGTLNQETLATKAGVEGSLIATYREMDCNNGSPGDWPCAASNWVWGSVPSDDAHKGSNAGDQQPIYDFETYQWGVGEADAYLNGKWITEYEGVVRANATLNLLDKVLAASPGEISTANANGIRGEAIFLRAHYHFEAYRMWGSIPYYRAADTDFRKANEAPSAVLADLLVDLDSAIALLPATPRNGDKGRVTSWTAKAYKGRVQAYGGDWPGALTTLRDVKASGPFGLQDSFNHVWTGFTAYENGVETILAYESSVNTDPNGENSNFGERLNFPYSGSHFTCCGFHQPTQNLVNFFAVDDSGLPPAITAADTTAWNAPCGGACSRDTNFVAGDKTRAVDPRLDWTVGRFGVPYKDWGLPNPSWIRDVSYSGPYSPKKNAHESASGSESTVGWVPTQTNGVNIHLFRYADMLLMLAEAEVEAGVLENARAIVNQIRTRAAAAAQGPGTDAATIGVPLTQAGSVYSLSEPWADYKIGLYTTPWTDQAFARHAVRVERRLELAMEGQRFFDLRRWAVAAQVLNDYVAIEKLRTPMLTGAVPFAARHAWYPIPAIQIDLSRVGKDERLVQNPGW
jgi:hypothetical protein